MRAGLIVDGIGHVPGSTLMAVEVKVLGDEFQAGTPHRLFDVPCPSRAATASWSPRDGRRFLVNTAPGQTTEAIEVLMN